MATGNCLVTNILQNMTHPQAILGVYDFFQMNTIGII